MKRMTKSLMKNLLKDDNYNEGLGYIATRVLKAKTYTSAMTQLENDYERMMNYAYDFENECDTWDDFSMNVERIYTAIYTAIEEQF